ncbi:MAG: hypothetical protein AAB465_01625 [Patescibacteria group bacterium]
MTSSVKKIYEYILVKYSLIFNISLLIVLALTGFWLLVKPKMDLLKKGGSLDLVIYEEIINSQKTYLSQLKQIKKDFDSLNQDRIKKLNYVVADKPDLAATFVIFDNLTRQHGLIIDSISADFSDGVFKTKISISGGDYRTFKEFLNTLEKSVRIMDVSNLQVSVQGNKYTLDISTYYLSQ